MKVKEEFTITRHGKLYVLFTGLLDLAHEIGIESIDEEIIQVPSAANGDMAIVKAIVKTTDGKTFSGLGDASPNNVGKAIAPHVLRMASTRAKARALRDLCNVGVTALEETGGEADTPERGQSPQRQSSQASEPSRRTPQASGRTREGQGAQRSNGAAQDGSQGGQVRDLPATRKQLNYLEALASEQEGGMAGFEELAGKSLNELTRQEASDWVARLSGRSHERTS